MTSQLAPSSPDPAGASAGSLSLQTLLNRADFLRAARGKRVVTPGFILQIRARPDREGPVRIGFTCSKKVGNAVARNRAKRRLREIARLVLPNLAQPGTDYVMVGRAQVTAERNFELMCADLRDALAQVK